MESVLLDFSSILIFVLTGVITAIILKQYRRPAGYPPGPRIYPFVWNMPAIFGKNLIAAFRDMRKQYGDIFSLRIGSQWIVVINGYQNLKDALLKQGDIFNDRPDMYVFTRILENIGIIASSGQLWREHRQYLTHTLKTFGLGRRCLQDTILKEIDMLMDSLQQTKGENFVFKPIIQGVFCNIVTSVVFNKRYDYSDHRMQKIIDLLHENVTDSEFSGMLDIMPWLENLPGDIFRAKRLLKNEETLRDFVQENIEEHKQSLDGENQRDFIDAYLCELGKATNKTLSTGSELQLQRICRDLLLAGTDTTATNTRWAILHMINKPEIQEKMYQEIKDVIGFKRQPDMDDRTKMPYCDAVCYETLRISNVGPVSVPRTTKHDFEFKGFIFPANCVVMPCLDSVHFDENIFPDPEEFIPERFMDESSLQKYIIAFALGKRSCPGEVLARQELFLTLVSLVQRFKFLHPKGGKAEIQRKFGTIFYPAEYKLRVVQRDNV